MRLEEEIKQKEFKSVYNKVTVNLMYTYNWMDYKSKAFFKSFGLTPQQYNILRILRGQYPNPATINLLKDRMLDKMCDASRIVERLRIKDLIARTTNLGDRRAVDIIINDKGLDLLRQMDEPLSRFEKNLTGLNEAEALQLSVLLDKMRSKTF